MSSTLPCQSALTSPLFTAIEHSPVGICLLSADGQCLFSNRALRHLLHHFDGELPRDLFLQAPLGGLLRKHLASLASGQEQAFSLSQFRGQHQRRTFSLQLNVSVLGSVQDETGCCLAIVTDEQQHQARELELRKLYSAVENSGSAVVITDISGRIEYVNARFCDITGYSMQEVIGQTPALLRSGETDPATYRDLWRTIRANRKWRGTLRNRRKDGTLYWTLQSIAPISNEKGCITHLVSVGDDITQLKEYQSQLEYLAYFDSLTKLGNRYSLHQNLERLLERPRGKYQALLLVDLDHFQKVNDTLGHEAGDLMLSTLASRLRFLIPEKNRVFRLGGDEFAILLDNLNSLDQLQERLRDLVALITQPMEIGIHEIQTSASIGITLLGIDAQDPSSLLRNADLAMYRAKRTGRNGCVFFNRSMDAEASRTLALEHDLRQALKQGQLQLYFQPQVDLTTGRMIGLEALLRWKHPDRGFIPPDEFIPIAEDTGLILPIGRWVLEQACRTAASIRRQYDQPFRVAVNLSARQFADHDLVQQVEHTLAETGLPGSYLELEITESLLVNNFEQINGVLGQLRRLGISIAMDDFGTGYSSLNYLKKLEINQLKIDRSFVQDIPGDRDDMAITATIILMARQLGLEVIAEGVETEQQQQFLLRQGCRTGQGFYFSRPAPLEELSAYWSS